MKKFKFLSLFITVLFISTSAYSIIIHPVINPVVNSVIWDVSDFGENGVSERTYILDSIQDIESFMAKNDGSYSRDSIMNIPDFNGVYHTLQKDEMGFTGGRVQQNRILHSVDLTQWSTTASNVTNTTAILLQNEKITQQVETEDSHKYRFSFDAKIEPGDNTAFRFVHTDSETGNVTNGLTLSTELKRYCSPLLLGQTETGSVIFGIQSTGTGTSHLTFTNIMVEDVTRRKNQNPSEHIKTTTKVITKWYNTENGYTVDPISFIVTKTKGSLLTNDILLPVWQNVTNLIPANMYREFLTTVGWNTITCDVDRQYQGVGTGFFMGTLLEDNSTTASQYVKGVFTVPDNSKYSGVSLMIKSVQSEPISFPGMRLVLTGGTSQQEQIIFNHYSGEVTEIYGDGNYEIWFSGNYWYVNLWVKNNSSGNTTLSWSILPGYSKDGSVEDVSTKGSIIVDWAQRILSSDSGVCPLWLVKGGGTLKPAIIKMASAEKRKKIIPDAEGSVFVDFQHFGGVNHDAYEQIIKVSNSGNSILYMNPNNTNISSYDGFNFSNISGVIENNKAVSYWGKGKKQVTLNEHSSTESNYDGSFGDNDLEISSYSGMRSGIRKIIFSNKKNDSSYWETQTKAETIIPLGYEQVYDSNGDIVVDINKEKVYTRRH